MTNGSFMKVKHIFDLHKAIIGLEKPNFRSLCEWPFYTGLTVFKNFKVSMAIL